MERILPKRSMRPAWGARERLCGAGRAAAGAHLGEKVCAGDPGEVGDGIELGCDGGECGGEDGLVEGGEPEGDGERAVVYERNACCMLE